MFSKGVPQDHHDNIVNCLHIKEVLSHEEYLGLPAYVSRKKKKPFLHLKDRICKRWSLWMDQLVSWAGREELIKVVAQAIPTYTMSVFKLPKDLCSSIQSSINGFWWGHNKGGHKIHWFHSLNCRIARMMADWASMTLRRSRMLYWPNNSGASWPNPIHSPPVCLKPNTSRAAQFGKPA